MNSAARLVLLAVCLPAAYPHAQTAPQPEPQQPIRMEAIAPLVKQQFGPTFTVASSLPNAIIVGDFDGDGIEDVAIVADSKEPFPDSYQFKYSVADPYSAYFGMGNPAMSMKFATNDPGHNHHILVIFGAGPEAWRAASPKAKFVIVNLPFDTIETGRMLLKKNKPPIFVIKAQEAQIMDSCIYWEAKKKRWKWEPGNTVN